MKFISHNNCKIKHGHHLNVWVVSCLRRPEGKSVKRLADEKVSSHENINLIMMSYTDAGSSFRRSFFINWAGGGKVF